MDLHELVSAVKQLAMELGRTPTRAEFEHTVRNGHTLLAKSGGYSAILQAAGLDTYAERRSGSKGKVTNAIFTRNLEDHLAKYEPAPHTPPKPCPTFAVISDIHWPFHSQRVVDKFLDYVEAAQPEWVILNGDAWDMYSHAKFPRSHNVFTPRQEQDMARKSNEEFWAEVKRRAPNARCVQMMGNHDLRPMKRIIEVYPEAEDWISEKMTALFTFDGVETVMDARQELYLNDETIVFHGYRTQLGAHRDYTLMNCANGHTHRGGVVFRKIRGRVLWELNSGVAGDPAAKGLTYTSQKINEWTPGFGALDSLGPRFIPA